MRAVVLTGHGGMGKLEYHEDWPTPEPSPGNVVVKVAACGLNNIDINTRTAWYSKTVRDGITDEGGKGGFDAADDMTASWTNRRISFPRIQGCDVAGRIAAVGEDVDPTRTGEGHTVCELLQHPLESMAHRWRAVCHGRANDNAGL